MMFFKTQNIVRTMHLTMLIDHPYMVDTNMVDTDMVDTVHIFQYTCCNTMLNNITILHYNVAMQRWIIFVSAGKYVFPHPLLIKAVATYTENEYVHKIISYGYNASVIIIFACPFLK